MGVAGSYAEQAAIPAERLVPLPTAVTAQQAATALLQGLTAQILTSETCPLAPGDQILVMLGPAGWADCSSRWPGRGGRA